MEKLAISTVSPLVKYYVGELIHPVGVAYYEKEALLDDNVVRDVEADGDVFPSRSGKFWNLYFQYYLDARSSHTPYPYRIEIVDVEEYACITPDDLKYVLPGRTPIEERGPHEYDEGMRFDVDGPDGQATKILFRGPWSEQGCLNYISLWQARKE